jgi:hypothetical protein
MYRALFITLILFLTSNLYAKPHTSGTQGIYVENLSAYRIKFGSITTEVAPSTFQKIKFKKKLVFPIEHEITQQLHELLADLKLYYEMTEYIPGYTIQVYTGSNRQLAFQIKDKLAETYPNLDVEVQYKQPNFTVRIGKFLERIEAYEIYVGVKKLLPQSIIRPTYFPNRIDTFHTLYPASTTDSDQDIADEHDIEDEEENILSKNDIQEIEADSLEDL